MYRKIAVVHLIDDRVIDVFDRRTFVKIPSFRICSGKIDNGGTFAVDTDSLGPNTGSLVEPFALIENRECIKLAIELSGTLATHVPLSPRVMAIVSVAEVFTPVG